MFERATYRLPVFLGALLACAPPWAAGGAQDAKTSGRRVAAARELWRGNDSKARLQALRRLGRLGPDAASAVPALIAGLSDRDPKIREETADALQRIGPPARPAVPALLAALNDPDRETRTAAARALRAAKPDPKVVMPALVANLRAGPDRRCPVVVCELAALGEPAVPLLIELLKDDDRTVRWMASDSLRVCPISRLMRVPAWDGLPIRPTNSSTGIAACPLVGQTLSDRSSLVRVQASRALGFIGGEAVAALGPLRARLGDPDPEVRRAAEAAIKVILKPDP